MKRIFFLLLFISSFSFAQQKFIVNPAGTPGRTVSLGGTGSTWTAAALGIAADGEDQGAKIVAAFNDTAVNTIWFESRTSANYTVTSTISIPAGKVLKFEKGNKLVGTGTINGGIYEADYKSWILDTLLTVNPSSVAEWWSIKWFGAVGDYYTQDDYKAIQKSIELCIKNNITYCFVPRGTYKITRPLIMRDTVNNFVTLDFFGEGNFWTNVTVIQPTQVNTFALGIQLGKSVKVRHMTFKGSFVPPNQDNRFIYFNQTLAQFTDGVCRDSRYSAFSGIVIDPFTNNDPGTYPPDGGYPGLSSYYGKNPTASPYTGSTATIIEDVDINGFVIGVNSSPNGVTLNAELTLIDKLQVGNCKIGVSGGQAQEKANRITNLACWGGTHTVFANRLYGSQTPGHWYIDGVNVAGAVINIVNINTGNFFPSYFTNFYVESNMRIGDIIGETTCELKNWVVDFEDLNNTGYISILNATDRVTISNSNIRYYGQSIMIPFSGNPTFRDCVFSGTPMHLGAEGNVPYFVNCQVVDFNNGFHRDIGRYLSYGGNLSPYTYGQERTIKLDVKERDAEFQKLVTLPASHEITMQLNTGVIRSGTLVSRTFTFDCGTGFNNENPKAYIVGSPVVFLQSSLGFSDVTPDAVGLIIAKDSTSITVGAIGNGFVNGRSYYIFPVYPYLWMGSFMGNVTDSRTIDSVRFDLGSTTASDYIGVAVELGTNLGGSTILTDWNNTTKTFKVFPNGGWGMATTGTQYFGLGATKKMQTTSDHDQTWNAVTASYILPKGMLITEMAGTTRAKKYLVTNTGYNIIPAGQTRQATWIRLYGDDELPVYADNAAAIAGGMRAGETYRTSAGVKMVVMAL